MIDAGTDLCEVVLAGNPFSGRGRNRAVVQRLAVALEAGGLRVRTAWEPAQRRALLSDPELGSWCRCVVAAGGDGTLADVVNDLEAGGAPGRVPLAALPIGNENLFARQFGFTALPEQLAEAVRRGRTTPVDAGRAGPRLFTLMASAGLDAEVVRRMARWRTRRPGLLRRVGRMSYLPRICGSLGGYAYPRVTLEADGRRVTGSHAFVFNLPQYGMGLGIGAHAEGSDGLLDWMVFKHPGPWRAVHYAWCVLRGRHLGRPDVVHGRAARLRLTAETPVPVQADGDPAGWTPSEIEVCPHALRVIVV